MKRMWFCLLIAISGTSHAGTQVPKVWSGDSAIRRVDNCVCYKSIDAQNLQPWEIAWDDADKLRTQISHCVCQAQIDIPNVEKPRRYLVPGTVLK